MHITVALNLFHKSMDHPSNLAPDIVRNTASKYKYVFDYYGLDDVGPLSKPSDEDGDDGEASIDDTNDSGDDPGVEVPEAEEEASPPTAHQCLQVTPCDSDVNRVA